MGWIAIPGLVRIIMCFQLLVFVLVQMQRATNDGYPELLAISVVGLDPDSDVTLETVRLADQADQDPFSRRTQRPP